MALLSLFLGAAGCNKTAPPVTAPAGSSSPVAVHIVMPTLGTISRTIAQPGAIQAFEQTPIYAKIPGYVQKWAVDIGDEVRKDQLLAELWVPELVSELNLKKEQVQQAKKLLVLAKTQVLLAMAQIKEAEAALGRTAALNDYWKGQSERFANLVSQNVLEKQTQDDALSQYRASAAAVMEAQAKIGSATALQQEKEAAHDKAAIDIRAAEADLARQGDLVRYATFLAPYDGVVTRRNVNTFDFVQPPTAGKGEPLYVVERRDRMRIFVEIPEADMTWVSKGTPARVRVPSLQGREFSGKVARTSYALERTTRTLLAEIDLANPKDELRPGMYVYAMIEAQLPGVLTLPAAALVTEGDVNVGYQTYCYLVENGRLMRTQIETGARNGQLVQILKKRLSSASAGGEPRWAPFSGTEAVVQRDVAGLKDGQAVETKPAGK